jgi:hypothetical protein
MSDLTTYENMSALHATLPETMRPVLVNYWRRLTWGTDTNDHRVRVRRALPSLWAPLFPVTVPDVNTLNRWERDHGYQSR